MTHNGCFTYLLLKVWHLLPYRYSNPMPYLENECNKCHKILRKYLQCVPYSLQYFDAVGWATGRASDL